MSRDVPEKHHPRDPGLYRKLHAHGMTLRIMGGRRLGMAESGGLEILPAGALAPEHFLAGLDCFFYRTHPEWLETWGRVVIEAMACGLPVVCESRGGYSEVIEHGRNGLLSGSEVEAMAQRRQLRDDPGLWLRIGQAGRGTALPRYGPDSRAGMLDYSLR